MFSEKQPVMKILRALEKLARRDPHPALVAALGRLYVEALEGGGVETGEVLGFLSGKVKETPSSADLQEILSRVLTEASRRSTDPALRSQLLEALGKAVELKRKEIGGLLVQLAHLHLQAGETLEAQEHLALCAMIDPENVEAKGLLERFKTGRGAVQGPGTYDLERLMGEVGKIRGFLTAIAADRGGVILAEKNALNVEGRRVANALLAIYNNVRDASLRMEIGEFERCEIEGPFGRAYVAALGGLGFLAAFDDSARGEAAPSRLDYILESCSIGEERRGSDS
ncbi:MAG: hypothetical protein V2A58_05985 [Planctomycetota bacterium]